MVSEYSAASMNNLNCLNMSEVVSSGFTAGVKPRVKCCINFSSEYNEPKCMWRREISRRESTLSHPPSRWLKYSTALSMCD